MLYRVCRVSMLGILILILARYLISGYLDPEGHRQLKLPRPKARPFGFLAASEGGSGSSEAARRAAPAGEALRVRRGRDERPQKSEVRPSRLSHVYLRPKPQAE